MSLSLKKSLVTRVVFSFALVAFGMGLISVVFFSISETKSMRARLQDEVRNLTTLAKFGYSASVWNLDTKSTEALNRSLLTAAPVVAVNIYDDGRFFSGMSKDIAHESAIPQKLEAPFLLPADHPAAEYLHQVRDKIYFEGKLAGEFELFYTETQMNQEIRLSNLKLVLAFVVICLSTVLVMYLSIRKLFLLPILSLSAFSKRVTNEKNYSIRISGTHENEIGILYDSVNEMLSEIGHSEEELRQTRGYLIDIIESMPSVIISIDENGIVTQWNRAAERFSGLSKEAALGRCLWKVTPLFEDIEKLYLNVIEKKAPVLLTRKLMPGRGQGHYSVSLFPLLQSGVRGVVIRMDDVSELEKKEEQLRQVQKMETVGTLAGGLAHDFNNILSGVVGTVSILKYKMNQKTLGVDQVREYVDTIEASGKRAAELVQQLLTLSRKKEMYFVPHDLSVSVRNAAKICENTFDKCVSIELHLPDEPANILADPGQVEQSLLNVCINAYHAMTLMRGKDEVQGGTLGISIKRIDADRLFCTTHPEARETSYWALSVEDTGVGMNARVLQKIFDPFFTTKGAGKGTGLGLAMVYNIVQLHNGFIDVYSEPGRGTRMNLYFPVGAVGGTESTLLPGNALPRGRGVILVVDDEQVMRNLARDILLECGYQVLFASDGVEGLQTYKDQLSRIDMVLIDMVMPRMNGFQLYQELKKLNPKIKVLLASGFRKDERVESLLSQGVGGFIQKPYTIEKLAEAVHKVINT